MNDSATKMKTEVPDRKVKNIKHYFKLRWKTGHKCDEEKPDDRGNDLICFRIQHVLAQCAWYARDRSETENMSLKTRYMEESPKEDKFFFCLCEPKISMPYLAYLFCLVKASAKRGDGN